jgi:farnesyl diphosphate synthase
LPSIELYTEDHYFTVVTWKTAYYTILLPIVSGLLISSSANLVDHPELTPILLEIGNYFQVQDDYLDCYGDVKLTGKIGTDIQERKCSWLIVQAMKILSVDDEKRKRLCDNYGIDDPVKVQLVKDIYQEMNLSQVYKDYEEKTYNDILHRIEAAQFHCQGLETLLKQILNMIHSRDK